MSATSSSSVGGGLDAARLANGHAISAATAARAPSPDGAVAFLRRVLANKTTLPESYVAVIQSFLQRIEHLHKPVAKYRSRFDHEYGELCASIDDAPWFTAAITPQTKHTLSKNRYRDVLPFDRTRVKLSLPPPHDYINANWIDDEYIACCAPVPPAIRDFWRMVWECDVAVVLMLTNFVERERIKADLYWDARREPVDFGGVVAQLRSEEADATYGFVVRTFHVWTPATQATPRVVLHVQLTTWPDHGVLRDFRVIAPMLELVNSFRVRATSEQNLEKPHVIVHCSAGIGRSGTFIAIDEILKLLHAAFAARDVHEGETLLQQALDVRAVVHRLRSQRPGMVQTPEQYEMIYRYVAAVLTNQQPW